MGVSRDSGITHRQERWASCPSVPFLSGDLLPLWVSQFLLSYGSLSQFSVLIHAQLYLNLHVTAHSFIHSLVHCDWSLSCVWFFATPRTVACQAPLSMGFSRQEYWSGLPYPPLGDLPNLGIKPRSAKLKADIILWDKVFRIPVGEHDQFSLEHMVQSMIAKRERHLLMVRAVDGVC